MPYFLEYQKGEKRPWKIKDSKGKIVGSAKTKPIAEKSIRARLAGAHGWRPKK